MGSDLTSGATVPTHASYFNASIGTAWVQTMCVCYACRVLVRFNASIGTAWVQTHAAGRRAFWQAFDLIVSMPQSAQHGFRRGQRHRGCDSWTLRFNASIGTAWVQTPPPRRFC